MFESRLFRRHVVRPPTRTGFFLLVLTSLWLNGGTDKAMAGNVNGDADIERRIERHLRELTVNIGDRSTSRPAALERARDYIRLELEGAGLDVAEQPYEFRGLPVANIIATLPGTDPAVPYYLVGAHYDTVFGTPGADDNASAVAVLLELARKLAARPPTAPVKLVAFTLEEPPAFNSRHQGSRVFTRRLEESNEEVLGAVVLEMVGYTSARQDYPLALTWAGYPDEGNYIAIVSNWRSRRFAKTLLEGFRANPGLPVESLFVPFNGWVLPDVRLSDHASFWDKGIPAVMVTDTAFFRNPHYHGPSDKMETLDIPFMAQLVESLEKALEALGGPGR
ncbi:MAG: M28 family peptidase [Rhodospirillales bacterium]